MHTGRSVKKGNLTKTMRNRILKAMNKIPTKLLKKNPNQQNKIHCLSNLEVSEFLIQNNVKIDTELLAKDWEQTKAGKKDLANYLLSRTPKSREDLISTTWKMQGAKAIVDCINIPHMGGWEDCQWLQCPVLVLTNNRVHPIVFAEVLQDLMINSRGKNQNIFIAGPANCGKTFLISPLQNIFKTFSNPSNDEYAWLGAKMGELIFLNYFRWSPEMIAWKDLLLLLEGRQPVHLPSPKIHYALDITMETHTPIIAK